jgi:hypothetical protein
VSSALGEGPAVRVRVAVLDPQLAAAGDKVERLSGRSIDDAVVRGDGPSPVVGGAGRGLHLVVHPGSEAAPIGPAGDDAARPGGVADGAVDGLGLVRGPGAGGSQVVGRLGCHELELEWPSGGSHGGDAGKTLEWISKDWVCSYQSEMTTAANFIVAVVDLSFAGRVWNA